MTIKLTKEEEQFVLEKRKADETKRKNEEKYSIPFRIGILKHNLYDGNLCGLTRGAALMWKLLLSLFQ